LKYDGDVVTGRASTIPNLSKNSAVQQALSGGVDLFNLEWLIYSQTASRQRLLGSDLL
jgi:hypothetical protein